MCNDAKQTAIRVAIETPEPRQPAKPNGQLSRPSSWLPVVEWPFEWAHYFLSQSPIGKAAEQIAKLSVFVAIVIYVGSAAIQALNARNEADTKYREEIRDALEKLSPVSTEATATRQWAFITLGKFVRTAQEIDGLSDESRQFYVDAGKLQFSGLDLSKLDFGAATYESRIFEGADLTRAKLSGADLKHAVLTEAILEKANMSRANLYGARLDKSQLVGAELQGAILCRANFHEAILSDVHRSPTGKFSQAAVCLSKDTKASNVDFRRSTIYHVVFDDMDLTGSNFQGALLVGKAASGTFPKRNSTSFRNAILTNADFTNVDLSGVDLTGAKLSGCILNGADLANAIGLTPRQISQATINQQTRLPPEINP